MSNVVQAITTERPYTLRRLKEGDLQAVLRIIHKLGLVTFKPVLIQIVESRNERKKDYGLVLNVADVILGALNNSDALDEIYSLYADLSGMPVADLKEMEFGTLPLMIYDSFQDARNTSFFRVLAKSS